MNSRVEKPEIKVPPEAMEIVREGVARIGITSRVEIIEGLSKKTSRPVVRIKALGQQTLDPKILVAITSNEQGRGVELLLSQVAMAFSGDRRSLTAADLLEMPAFKEASLQDLTKLEVQFNPLLGGMVGNRHDLPALYGSTSGLNMAEVLETAECARAGRERLGVETVVLFDHGGHDTKKAREMLADSLSAVSHKEMTLYEAFEKSLGETAEERRLMAARLLLEMAGISPEVVFIGDGELTRQMGSLFTLGKLLLLGVLSGSNPGIFKETGQFSGSEIAEETVVIARRTAIRQLGMPISEINRPLAGFSYYAREAVLAADTPGNYLMPLKLTDHANIYKILASYGGLRGQRADGGGAIVCPVRRERIQTRFQAAVGSDPVDAIVLAFLAQRSPEGFRELVADFRAECRVLSVDEALQNGHADRKLIVEDYFAPKRRRLSS